MTDLVARPGDDADAGPRLSPSAVFADSWAVLRSRPLRLMAAALAFWALPMLALEWLIPRLVSDELWSLGAYFVATEAAAAPFRAAMVPVVWATLAGERLTPGAVMRAAAAGVGAAFVIGVFTAVAYLLSALLLVVPMLMLACRWLVAIPAAVIERKGPWAALRRSAGLSRGSRWRVLAAAAMFWAGAVVLMIFGQRLAAAVRGEAWGWAAALAYYVAAAAVNGLVGVVAVTALYRRLRIAREGEPTETAAAVFD
jgi:hypothetical protein